MRVLNYVRQMKNPVRDVVSLKTEREKKYCLGTNRKTVFNKHFGDQYESSSFDAFRNDVYYLSAVSPMPF